MALQIPFPKLSANPINGVGSVATQFGLLAAEFISADAQGLVIPSNPSLQGGETDLTFAAWVYLTSTTGAKIILSKDDNRTTAGSEYYFAFYQMYGSFVMQVEQATTKFIVSSIGVPVLNTWYFVVGWFDHIAGTLNIQVNNGSIDTLSGLSNATHITDTPFSIGSDADSLTGLPAGTWDGALRSIAFFKRVLSSQERTALWNAVGYLYTINTNYIGTYNGTLPGFVSNVPFQFSENIFSCTFNGTDDRVQNNGVINFNVGASLSIWFNVPSFPGNSMVLLGKSSSNFSVVAFVNNTTIEVNTDTVGTNKNFIVPAIIPNVWYNLIIVRDSGGNTHVYLNGIESISGGQAQASGMTLDQVGRYTNGIFGDYYAGLACELRIWSGYVLTAQDIASINNGGGTVGAPDLYFKMNEGSGTLVNNYGQSASGVPLAYDQLPVAMQNEGQDTFPAWWDLDEISGVRRNKRQEALPASGTVGNNGNTTVFQPSQASGASINVPPGIDPSSLQDGDIWVKGSAIKIFIAGIVEQFALSGNTPQIVAFADLTAQTAAATVTSFVVGTNNGSFLISGYINVTAIATDVIQLQVAYTDINSNSKTAIFFGMGLTTAGLSATGDSNYPVMGEIKCKGGTTITVSTVLTVGAGTVAYGAGATIIQLR